jgi:hypothetical protein
MGIAANDEDQVFSDAKARGIGSNAKSWIVL